MSSLHSSHLKCEKTNGLQSFGGERFTKPEVVFFTLYSIWLGFCILDSSLFSESIALIIKPVNALCAVALFIFEIRYYEGITKREAIAIPIIVCLGVSFVNADRPGTFLGILFILSARRFCFRKTARVTILVTSIMLAVVIASASLGIIENYLAHASGRMRFYLGFRYALYPARYALMITCLAVYLCDADLGIVHAVVLLLLNGIIYYLSDSRLSFLLSLAVMATALIYKFFPRIKQNRFLCLLLKHTYLLAALVSIATAYFFSDSVQWMHDLNAGSFLAGRLSMGQRAFREYGVTILGQPVETTGLGLDIYGDSSVIRDYFYIDCLYIELLVRFGLITFAIFIGSQTAVLYQLNEHQEFVLMFILSILAVYCIFDNLAFRLSYNPFLIIAGILLRDPVPVYQGKHFRTD